MDSLIPYKESIKDSIWTLSKKVLNTRMMFKNKRSDKINLGLLVVALKTIEEVSLTDEADFEDNNNITHADLVSINTMICKITGGNVRPTFYLDKTNETEISCESKCKTYDVFDADGNGYYGIDICGKVWMDRNLMTTKYNDNSDIPYIDNSVVWVSQTVAAMCYYNHEILYKHPYGVLYNQYAVDTNKLAPIGWHVATEAEWQSLINCIGTASNAGGKLKEIGLAHWDTPNTGAVDSVGFSAVGGGFREGSFYGLKAYGKWWTSGAGYNAGEGLDYTVAYNSVICDNENIQPKYVGLSVRCVKD